MSEWRYHFHGLRDNALVDTLPLENVRFSYELRGVGTLSGDLPLYDTHLTARRVLDATIPDRTKIFVERDNTLVWGGRLIPPRDYSSSSRRVTLSAEETIGALAQRFLPTMTFTQTDQLDIVRGIIDSLRWEPGGDLGLKFGPGLSGVLRDRTYSGSDRTAALTAITDLSEVIGGFEFATQTAWGDTGPEETLLLGYPRLGKVRAASPLVLEYDAYAAGGGNVLEYSWADGPGLFTRSWAVSDTEDGVQMAVKADNSNLLSAGYPLLEQAESYEGVTSTDTLAMHAQALALYAGGHHVTAAFTVVARPGFELGDWTLGDDVLVRISDARFPPDPVSGAPGFAGYMRLVGAEVSPDAEGPETYTLTMADFIEAL